MVTSCINWRQLILIEERHNDVNRHFCVFIDVNLRQLASDKINGIVNYRQFSSKFFFNFLKRQKTSKSQKTSKKSKKIMPDASSQLTSIFAWRYHYYTLKSRFHKASDSEKRSYWSWHFKLVFFFIISRSISRFFKNLK